MYQDQYSTTTTLGETSSFTYMQGFGLEEKFTANFFGATAQYDFKQNWNFSGNFQSGLDHQHDHATEQPVDHQPALSCNGSTLHPAVPSRMSSQSTRTTCTGRSRFGQTLISASEPVSPNSQTVLAEGSASFTLPTSAHAGYSASLTSFSVAGLPAGATASFSPNSGSPGFTSTLTVTTSMSTPAGSIL